MRSQPPTDLQPHFLTHEDLTGVIDWPEFFGNENPVELDIGCGRGLFLVTAATRHPERNFLGMELDFTEGRRAARRLQRRNLENARVLGGDAVMALRHNVAAQSISAAHVYFPDPWWKRRHRRRRLFTDRFADQLATILRPGGIVHSWTDVADYFEVIASLMDHHAAFETLPAPEERAPEHDMDYHTSFERTTRKRGAVIQRGRWRRRPLA